MSTLQDIPVEVFLDNLLPLLELHSLLRLTCTSKFFLALGSEDLLWKNKLKEEYNFDGGSSARTTGWKIIYKGLRDPQVFVWGSASNGRLGLGDQKPQPIRGLGGCPTPLRLKIPDALVVDIVAGGWCFNALDSRGRIHVWGQLKPGFALATDGFSDGNKIAPVPMKLKLPDGIRIGSLKCGRSFTLGLDQHSHIWQMTSWGLPCSYIPPLLTQLRNRVIQIECGWAFASALTAQGEVFVWFPFQGDLETRIHEHEQAVSETKALAEDGVIQCSTWKIDDLEPIALPDIPTNLPPLREGSKGGVDTKLVKIAAGETFVIGLTDGGHVLGFNVADYPLGAANVVRWDFLQNFCDVNAIHESGVFTSAGIPNPEEMTITHISAHFRTFVAYSTGSTSHVLMSDSGALYSTIQPKILPDLQNRSVISVVLGDYHFGAVTSDGDLLTWGKYSTGALGLGDPREIPAGKPGGYATDEWKNEPRPPEPPEAIVPGKVKFGKDGRKMLCFAAAAAGWHTGALVIDLRPDNAADENDNNDGNLVNLEPHRDLRGPLRSLRVRGGPF